MDKVKILKGPDFSQSSLRDAMKESIEESMGIFYGKITEELRECCGPETSSLNDFVVEIYPTTLVAYWKGFEKFNFELSMPFLVRPKTDDEIDEETRQKHEERMIKLRRCLDGLEEAKRFYSPYQKQKGGLYSVIEDAISFLKELGDGEKKSKSVAEIKEPGTTGSLDETSTGKGDSYSI